MGPPQPIGSTVTSLSSGSISQSAASTSTSTPVVDPSSADPTPEDSSSEKTTAEPIPSKEVPKKSYSQVLKNSSKGMNLSYVPSEANSPVIIDEEDIVKEVEYWQTTLVGTVLGKQSTLVQIETLVSKYWTHITTPEIMYFSKGWYYFRFASVEDMQKIRSDTWNVNGFPLVFKPWSPTVIDELNITHVPVWVLFPSLDPCFWSKSALSKVASAVGNPICADEHTTHKSKLAFARILVDVDLSKELPKAIQINSPYRANPKPKPVYRPKPVVPTQVQVASIATPSAGKLSTSGSSKSKPATSPKKTVAINLSNRFAHLQNEPILEPVEPDPVENKVDCGAILETHVKSKALMDIYRSSFSGFHLVHNTASHSNGCIWVLWRFTVVMLTVLSHSAQHIHCLLLHHASQMSYEVTFVYAFNTRLERQYLWQLLSDISKTVSHPWVCMGDFNVVLNVEERLGSAHLHMVDMKEFGSCLDTCGLVDHPATGCHFTWNNKQGDGLRWAKLDRTLTNSHWVTAVGSSASFLTAGVSDHSPGMVVIQDHCRTVRRNFKFMNCWALSPQFMSLVRSNWTQVNVGGKIASLFFKLKGLKKPLRELHLSSFSGLTARVKSAKAALLSCQEQLQLSPLDTQLLLHEKQLQVEYSQIKRAEMQDLVQRAKVNDVKLGDGCTKFFYNKIAARKARNTIGSILDENGKRGLDYRMNKSPGTDGYPTGFFLDAWEGVLPHIIGPEQAAFIANRDLSDNSMMAYELASKYGRAYLTPRCLLKVDIRKAFDYSLVGIFSIVP
ncbi:uncharacterized protein LOC141590117 [Silene latifolia]|uniref:uncharacterized protein LOC141590117 n=1 Tax=Silene latifolia TaxID=37657 RepID=UPI003D77C6D0